jgi:micrococcal nuclease
MYTYSAHVLSVYDGDTITVEIDLGFRFSVRNFKIRLYGINTPEVKGPTRVAGLVARDALRAKVLDKDITLRTLKDTQEKYGRWLGILEVGGENINDWMVANGYAEPFMID